MKFTRLSIKDVILIEPDVFGDARGFFMETWHARKFAEAGIDAPFVQDNHSRSANNILRGLHYQVQQPQGKLVRAIAGEIFDVAVDLRKRSPTYGQWVAAVLSSENKHMLWVPPGFAHGFYVTGDGAEVVYKCSEFYAPEYERSIRWDDPDIGINWPLVGGAAPILSAKDAAGSTFREAESYS